MTDYTKTIVDVSTGEVSVVPLSEEETNKMLAEIEAISEERRIAAEKKQAFVESRNSAKLKLAALGLTEDEIEALIS